MTIDEAKKTLNEKRALVNSLRKEITSLQRFILDNGGTIEKRDLTERNYGIFQEWQAGTSIRDLALKYMLTEESIRRIYDRELHKQHIRY